ncbi:MAG: translational GTPase TypA [Rickettsiales bacterium]|nr:translational GTPase TypA [Rickettsiales bacterium]|tara:strand:- start:8650 stop:10464 length:1815 start_codon:yes stop_codon:yes gene_type:complete
MISKIRNIAIIAHVDHGKTTLIDSLLKQTGMFRTNEQVEERVMDSGDLEKERGITILAKPTSIKWNDFKINIIDTPGHADFGGEVERVLCMADGVILLTDASEGPMPQTKFVLGKALSQGLNPIVIINKIDKNDSRPDDVLNEIFDLFVTLDANDSQLDFPVLYASGKNGWCVENINDKPEDLKPLLNLIIKNVKEPDCLVNKPFSMLATLLSSDNFLGRCLTGKIQTGNIKVNDQVNVLNLDNQLIESGRLTKLFSFEGTKRISIDQAQAGDIICIAGLSKCSVSDTICFPEIKTAIKSTPVDPPTMSITITVNDSPYAGMEGEKITSNFIRERLLAEAESNVAITFNENEKKDSFEIGGRGELQLGVLIETMRREKFELNVSRPKVLFKFNALNNKLEPIEEVTIDVDEEYTNSIINSMNKRKAEMIDMQNNNSGKTRLKFRAPSRTLIGYQNQFLTETRGTGVIYRVFDSYDLFKGEILERKNGALISTETGTAVAYAIFNLQERGIMFIEPQCKVYKGMVVGEHSKENDLEINVLKGKQLTNIRASGSDKAINLVPPLKMSLEQMISYIKDDELLEVTPLSLRLRKKELDSNKRKREGKR